ncbi:piggyBac transposable element-derived protein 4-like [Cydia pomonella]|uniref:piggyBac transposable element-derived protein 4-like n=1 Tax=Cydia pomonella TaxID=82600 RepID=UPI002ADE745C|nr:piggyBac transposable element-derived protein 4-like [Cydia pomonella]
MDTPEDDQVMSLSKETSATSSHPQSEQPAWMSDPLYEFGWKPFPKQPLPHAVRREIFDESECGPTITFSDPYNVFVYIWDKDIMEKIALETNKYAQEVAEKMIHENCLLPSSRICEWKDTTPDELYVYFGILLAMGVVVKSRRLGIISHLNKKFQDMYKMGQNIALDESLLHIQQSKLNKTAMVGVKSYEICDCQTGFLWRFDVRTKKTGYQPSNQDPLTAAIPALILRLIQGLENKGHTLWMDSFYNSPLLARQLKQKGVDCVGTLRTNRPFVPLELTNLKKHQMVAGQVAGVTSGDVDLIVWRGQNRVATISTYHGNFITTGEDGERKPLLIRDYNTMMGVLDKKDKKLSAYPIERDRTQVWYKKLFLRLINVSALNA